MSSRARASSLNRLQRLVLKLAILGLCCVAGLELAWVARSPRGTAQFARVEAQPPAPVQRPVLVEGYVAARIARGETVAGAQGKVKDIYLPEVRAFLVDASTNAPVGKASLTDLSGRFSLRAKGPQRVKICLAAKGFVSVCDARILPIGKQHLNVGKLLIQPQQKTGQTTLYGNVRLADGSTPRQLDPIASVNALGRVELQARSRRAVALVNNFGEYVLTLVPGREPIQLAARVEAGQGVQRIRKEAGLDKRPAHEINLVVKNHSPKLRPIVAADAGGRRIKVAQPGQKVELSALVEDQDGDSPRFRWLVPEGSGTLSDTTTQAVSWQLPNRPGQYRIRLLAYDGKGGYDQSALLLRTDERGVLFAGTVRGTDGPAISGASVTVNGEKTATDNKGYFRLFVKDADRFVLNIRKPGFALQSKVYGDAVEGGRWTLTRASVHSVDPRLPIDVVNERRPSDCPGPELARLNWRDYPELATAQWQDGKGRVIQPPKKAELPRLFLGKDKPITLGAPPRPGTKPWWEDQDKRRECGPGVRVRIPADSLVDANGKEPLGNVEIALSTVDLMSGEQMPGDLTVEMPDGSTQRMQSWGAASIEIQAGGRKYNLKPGSLAEVTMPIDPSQLLAGAPSPPTIPILFYDEKQGVWREEGSANKVGDSYVAKVEHFSYINTDILKDDQSCIRVLSSLLPPSYRLEVTVPMPGGAAPVFRSEVFNNAPPSEHVIINLPNDTNVVLVPIRTDNNTPIGTFVVNSGGPQVPENPNHPAGPPYNACATEVELHDLAVPVTPVSGEFLHGIFSFEATKIRENDGSLAVDPALAQALADATDDYYDQVDPNFRRRNLADFQAVNGFGGPGEVSAAYANSLDLGFGREMHCVKNGLDVACYVTNYGDEPGDDQVEADDAAEALAGIPGPVPVATVAMEYSQIEDLGAPGDSTSSDPDRVVKFFVYAGDGSQLLRDADLDNLGARPVPQLCMVCHGGAYTGGFDTGVPAWASRDDVKLGSFFLPFDVPGFTLPTLPGFTGPDQEAAFRDLNEDIVAATDPSQAILDVISGLYSGPTDEQVDDFVLPAWNGLPAEADMYKNVITKACRTCHVASPFGDAGPVTGLRFETAQQAKDRLGQIEDRVCNDHVMPHALRTHTRFWASVGPHQPARLQVFGDQFGNGINGWQGDVCGEFIPGVPVPGGLYTDVIQPIWDNRCTDCHIGGAPPAGLSLADGVSHGEIVGQVSSQAPPMNRITSLSVPNSYLIHKLENTQGGVPGGEGGQMPADGTAPLPAGDIDAIEDWVDAGAPPP